ncbi:MAG: undecaprenyl-diphosphatase [Candidatus Hydrogenedentota bacterium]
MEYLKAVLLATVEGLTEFIPISSTGHLVLVDRVVDLGFGPSFAKTFIVVIQLPAILSVVVYFWSRLWPFAKPPQERRAVFDVWLKVIVAVIPAGVLGLLFDDLIESYLLWEVPVAAALIAGGAALLYIESMSKSPTHTSIADLRYATALKIGLFQCLAMWPGMSRSASTIIGAMLLGASRPVAAEFSFFLAIPTMVGATMLTIVKKGGGFTPHEWSVLAVGCVVSFLVAYASIAFLMAYIQKHDFRIFGWYRIVLGIVVVCVYLLYRAE